jgi:hypothetical protein
MPAIAGKQTIFHLSISLLLALSCGISRAQAQATPPGRARTMPPRSVDTKRVAAYRELFPLLDTAPEDVAAYHYNPLTIVKIVNRLHPLGKEKALDALSVYLRARPQRERQGLFLVLRTLFDVPLKPSYMPVMMIGAPGPPLPKDLTKMPRFPLALIEDLPLLFVNGYSLAGVAERVEAHIQYFRAHGILRALPLQPTARPLDILPRLKQALPTMYGLEDHDEALSDLLNMAWEQLRRVEETLYPDPQQQHYTLNDRLILAIEADKTETVRNLLDQGADANSRNVRDQTARMLASLDKRETMSRLLVERGADINAKMPDGGTVLMAAAGAGCVPSVRLLLERGVQDKAEDKHGFTAVMAAAMGGSVEYLKMLLDRGGKAQSVTDYGSTPFLCAANAGSVDCMRLLLERGASAKDRDREGETALMKAVTGCGLHPEAVRFLLSIWR